MKLVYPSFEILTKIDDNVLRFIESIGRVCYKSEDKIKNGSDITFAEKLMKNGHESVIEHFSLSVKFIIDRGMCYDDKTEVLTDRGFKPFCDLNKDDLIYSKNENDKLELLHYKSKIEIDYNGEMHHYKNSMLDLLVTPNHNMYVFDYMKRSPNTRIWKFIESKNIKNKMYLFDRSCSGLNYNVYSADKFLIPGVTINRGFYKKKYDSIEVDAGDFYEFLGIWITDGSISFKNKCSGGKLFISQIKENGKKYIITLLDKLQLKYRYFKNNFIISNVPIFHFIKNNFIKNGDAKKSYYIRVPNFIKKSNIYLMERFLKGVIIGDGTPITKSKGYTVYTSSIHFAKDLAEISLKIGKSSNINIVKQRNKTHFLNGHIIKNNVSQYYISIYDRKKLHFKTGKSLSVEKYIGKVYCVELEKYHKIFVMRNGKSCWCGNSHELVRHRLASFSQESTRYVNYMDGLTFIIPPWVNIEPGEYNTINDVSTSLITGAGIEWLIHLFEVEKLYQFLREEKWSPQEARSILPNCLKTELIMTTNIREWRHIIKLRTAKGAHPQVIEIIRPLQDELKKQIPILFDF